MKDTTNFSEFLERVADRWQIIAVGIVAGVAIALLYSFVTAPEPGFSATARVRYIAPQGVIGAPTADTFVAMALSEGVQESAAESLSVNPAVLVGSVEAAIDSRDRNMVVVRVNTPGEDESEEMVLAVVDASIAKALEPVNQYVDYWTEKIEAKRAQLALIEARLDHIESQLETSTLTNPERRTLEELAFLSGIRRADASQEIRDNEFLLGRSATTLALLEDPAIEPRTAIPYHLSNILRGALLGLFAGIIVAAIASRRKEPTRTDA